MEKDSSVLAQKWASPCIWASNTAPLFLNTNDIVIRRKMVQLIVINSSTPEFAMEKTAQSNNSMDSVDDSRPQASCLGDENNISCKN